MLLGLLNLFFIFRLQPNTVYRIVNYVSKQQAQQSLAAKKTGKAVMLRGVDPAKWRSIRGAAALAGESLPEFVIFAAYSRATELAAKAARSARA